VTETKYGKYICSELKPEIREKQEQRGPRDKRMMEHVIWMDDEVIPGALYSELVWFWPGHLPPPDVARKGPAVPTHTHEFPEVLCYLGTDLNNPHDLGGEIEFWLDGEQFNLTKSFIAFIPGGMKHCPLRHISIGYHCITKPMSFDRVHAHNFAEMLFFIGGNPLDIRDLGAEIEFCLGDGEDQEKHIINTTSVVSIPPDLTHCPITFTRVDKPVIFMEVSLTRIYPRPQRNEEKKE